MDGNTNVIKDTEKFPSIKSLLISLTLVSSLILVVLIFYLILPHTYNPYIIDPSITETNERLFEEIESQENMLHSTLHKEQENGKIPISKELSILFRRTDLLHMQNELMRITDEINDYQHSGNQHTKAEIDKRIIEIKATQERISRVLSDKTHGGDLDPNWLLEE